MLAFITGSGLYGHEQLECRETETPFGPASFLQGTINGRDILLLPRHGEGHRNLPHHINHLANLSALKEAGATAVISCSVCGILTPDWPLATPILATDVYFPDNRLPDGRACSMFQQPGEPGRGHLLASSLINSPLQTAMHPLVGEKFLGGIYGHVNGPRFNSVTEIRALQQAGVDLISQTCGPEAVLANELELPYALLAFGVDYANGVQETPTPVETLQTNLEKAQSVFLQVIDTLQEPPAGFPFENFVYRFP